MRVAPGLRSNSVVFPVAVELLGLLDGKSSTSTGWWVVGRRLIQSLICRPEPEFCATFAQTQEVREAAQLVQHEVAQTPLNVRFQVDEATHPAQLPAGSPGGVGKHPGGGRAFGQPNARSSSVWSRAVYYSYYYS